jgi:hypothetical protein
MAEHTKLPWRVEKGTGLVWGDCTLFEDGTPDRLGVPVTDGQLERPWAQGKGPTYDEMEANAAHIVKCVNAYPDLVKARAAFLSYLQAENCCKRTGTPCREKCACELELQDLAEAWSNAAVKGASK